MECSQIENLILDHIDQSLCSSDYASVQSHIATCQTCAEFWKIQNQLDTAFVPSFSKIALSSSFETRILNQIEQEPLPSHFSISRNSFILDLLDLAGYLSVTALGGYALYFFMPYLLKSLDLSMHFSLSWMKAPSLPMQAMLYFAYAVSGIAFLAGIKAGFSLNQEI